jgi:VanZ family protein
MAHVSVAAVIALWLPVAVYMAAIFLLSSLQNPPAPPGVSDVNLHALVYFGLMLIVVRALARGTWSRVTVGVLLMAWAITVAYGASDEWHQMYVPSRHAELRDLAADAIGALGAAIGVKAWSIIRRL